MISTLFVFVHLAKEMNRLSQLENLRDEIWTNHEKSNSSLAVGTMCEADLGLLKEWQWNRFVVFFSLYLLCECVRGKYLISIVVTVTLYHLIYFS